MVDVCFTAKQGPGMPQWCTNASMVCSAPYAVNIMSVQEFRYTATHPNCRNNTCSINGNPFSNSTLTDPILKACNGSQSCSIHENGSIPLPVDTGKGGYVHVDYTCVQDSTLNSTTRTSLTSNLYSTRTQLTKLESSISAPLNTNVGRTSATYFATNIETYATTTQHFTSSLLTNREFPSTSVSNKSTVTTSTHVSQSETVNSTTSIASSSISPATTSIKALSPTLVSTGATRSMSMSTSTKKTVSAKPLTDSQTFQTVPVAIGVIVAVMLVVAVIIFIILYIRGKLEGLLAKIRRGDNRPNDNPSFCHISRGTLPEDTMSTYYSDIHLGDIDKPIVQTYNTTRINETTNVPDSNYNHIKHHQNNDSKTEAMYNHIGEIDINKSNLINTQTDTYSHVGQACNGETEYDRTINPHSHDLQMDISKTGKTDEGAYSLVNVWMGSSDQANSSKETSTWNEGFKSTVNEEKYIYSIPIKSVKKASSEDAPKDTRKLQNPEQ